MVKRSLKKGGELLGQGTFGCAFSPVIPCESNEVFTDGTVGKVMKDNYSTSEEVRVSKMVRKADPKSVYTNTPLGTCDVARSKIIEMNPNTKCPHIKNSTHRQIVYPHKGVSLDAFNDDMFTKDNFPGLVHLAKGLAMLAHNKLVHMDLKQENIIRMDTKKLLMIDFGISRKFKEFYSEDNYYLDEDYFLFPPDFKIYIAMVQAMWLEEDEYHDWLKEHSWDVVKSWDVDTLSTYLTKKAMKNMKKSMGYLKRKFELMGWTIDQFQKEIQNVFKRLLRNGLPKSDQLHVLESEMNKYIDRVDVYGFGIVMLQLYLESDVSESNSPFSHKCANIIMRCIHADPMYRYDPSELVDALTSACKLIDRKFPPRASISNMMTPMRPQTAPNRRKPWMQLSNVKNVSNSSNSNSPNSYASNSNSPNSNTRNASKKRMYANSNAKRFSTV